MTKHLRRALLSIAILAVVAGITVMPASANTLLYNQSTDFSSAFSSQNDTNNGGFGNFATTYDNFTLGSTSSILGVEWVGQYFGGSPAPISGFTLDFWGDSSGTPGGLLYSTFIPGGAGETFLQDDGSGNPINAYAANVNFVAAGGTQYWVSIEPDLGFPPQWGWETATGGDSAAYQCFDGGCGSISNDLAFSLYSQNVTPEPGSLLLLLTGMLGVALIARKKLEWLGPSDR